MVRTLITGAAGFTGRYVCRLLADRGHEVHGLVHGAIAEPVDGVAAVHDADLADLETINRILEEVRPDHVIHLAAIAFIAHGDVEQMYRSNVVGTRQLLEGLRGLGKLPKSIVLASSANVYGNAREGVLDETCEPFPANDYGVTKLAMEHVASLYSGWLPLIIARPFNYTGRGQSPSFLIPKIVLHVRERRPIIELGNLDVARDFSDVRTVAECYARLLHAPEAIGETFNVCSGRGRTLREVLDLAATISGHHLNVRVNPAFVRANEVRSLTGSPAKLQTLIGSLPSIPFEDTLRWMIED